MYKYINTCMIALVVFTCVQAQGQFVFKNIARKVANDLTNKPIVQEGFKLAGNEIVDFLGPITTLAFTLGQFFGNGQEIPSFTSNTNIVDLDYAGDEFKAGLGNEDAKLTIEELITKYGYAVEKHQVMTEDFYMLSVFRIPNKGPPVFLMHGLTGSADDFIISGPVSGLAYLLANDGFDVWMGNARGNKHSCLHAFLKPSESNFWDFSWHEIGYYDLPAMIDYVLETVGRETVRYIGHSQGTTSFFVMASERPEYNKKIDIMIALSPVAFLSNMKSPILKLLAAGTTPIYAIMKSAEINDLFGDTKLNRILKAVLCGLGNDILCSSPILLTFGVSISRVNVTNLPVLLSHEPSGSSAKQFAHYGQTILSGKFRQFDYGVANLDKYGSEEPPEYELGNIVAPVVLYYGPEDWISQPKDVEKLASRLSNVVEKNNVPMFNHMDFILAKDFKITIYPGILNWFKK